MKIIWDHVTWYSKLAAVILFLLTFAIAFKLGSEWQEVRGGDVEMNDGTAGAVVGLGEHCGGFIKDAPMCEAGLHCQLKVNMPDTGGACAKD